MADRPPTSHTARPTTSGGSGLFDPSADSYIDRDPQYTAYSQEYSLEDQDESDESDDEDVFAFLPPSTAQASQSPSMPSPAQVLPLSQPPPSQLSFPHHHSNATVPSQASPLPPFSPVADPFAYPPPIFDPRAPAGPPATSIHFVGIVDSPSPPSTGEPRDSQSFADDTFRLRKLGSAPTTTSSSQIPLDDKHHTFLFQEKRHQSTALSDLSTVDPELDGADSVSIKSVYLLPSPTRLDVHLG